MISMYSASLGSEKIGCIVSNWHVDWLIDWLIDVSLEVYHFHINVFLSRYLDACLNSTGYFKRKDIIKVYHKINCHTSKYTCILYVS